MTGSACRTRPLRATASNVAHRSWSHPRGTGDRRRASSAVIAAAAPVTSGLRRAARVRSAGLSMSQPSGMGKRSRIRPPISLPSSPTRIPSPAISSAPAVPTSPARCISTRSTSHSSSWSGENRHVELGARSQSGGDVLRDAARRIWRIGAVGEDQLHGNRGCPCKLAHHGPRGVTRCVVDDHEDCRHDALSHDRIALLTKVRRPVVGDHERGRVGCDVHGPDSRPRLWSLAGGRPAIPHRWRPARRPSDILHDTLR